MEFLDDFFDFLARETCHLVDLACIKFELQKNSNDLLCLYKVLIIQYAFQCEIFALVIPRGFY